MAIQVLQGKPGAGKSYNAVQRAAEAVKHGRAVITNLPVKMSNPLWQKAEADGLLFRMAGTKEVVTPDAETSLAAIGIWRRIFADGGSEFMRDGPAADLKTGGADDASLRIVQKVGPLVIVDEGAATFQQMVALRRGKDEAHRGDFDQLVTWFQHHRHYAVDILMLYQDHSQVPQQIKALVERWSTFTNTTEILGYKSWSMRTTARGFSTANAAALQKEDGRFSSAIFDLYDSHAEGSAKGEAVQLRRPGLMRVRAFWMRWQFMLLVVAGLSLPVMLWKAYGQVQHIVKPTSKPGAPGAPGVFGRSGVKAGPGQVVQTVVTNPLNPNEPPQVLSGPITKEMLDQLQAQTAKSPGQVAAVGTVTPQPVGQPQQPVARVAPVRRPGELPPDHATFQGYGHGEIFFADGSVIREAVDYPIQGWRTVAMSSCSITVERTDKAGKPEVRTFACQRGF